FAYDSESDKLVFFGGTEGWSELRDEMRSETWTYDTNTETWEMKSLEVKPPARSRGELAYDSASDRVILFEGVLDGGWETEEVLNDCWAYDLNNNLWNNVDWDWQEMTPALSPGNRTGSPLVYDIESDRMVIFSGWQKVHADAVCYNDTWTYDYNSNTWTNMSPAVLPPGRTGHAMAYSQEDDRIVMFGGETGWGINEETLVADTWIYDLNTNTWTNMSPPTNPTPRTFSSMGYDNETDIFVLYGGILTDVSGSHETWLYNLTSNTWTNATTASNPGDRWSASLPYDYKNNRLLLSGGGNWDGFNNEIWEYDFQANTWTELIPNSASPEVGVALSYDSESELLVAYGGPTSIAEDAYSLGTWTFNLTAGTWNNTYSLHIPGERSRQYLAYDIESDRTIMYGGVLPKVGQGEALGDTWSYNYIVNPPILVPGKVKNPAVSPNADEDALVLTWEAPDPIAGANVIGYNVYRGEESGVYELLAELGDVLTYTDGTAGYGITYYYTVTAVATLEGEMSNEVSSSLPFNPVDDRVYTFIAYGDTRASSGGGVSPLHDDLVSRYLQLSDPELILHTGDLLTQGGEDANWPGYEQSLSAVGEWDPNLKIYYAVGNHEQYTSGPPDDDWSTYLSHVDFSDVVDESAGETELYYSFDWRNIHFIFLNSIDGWVGENFTCPTAQWNWLLSDFENNNKEFIIVSMHNPSYSVRADRPDRWAQAAAIRAEFHDLFVQSGVDIVFAGHDHQYYHTTRDDIDYVVTGGGGAPLYEIDTEAPDWITGDVGFSAYHYCVCSIAALNSTHKTLSINVVMMDGTIADSFSFAFPSPTVGLSIITVAIIVGGAAVVVVVVVFFLRKRK
ncbi:MAG: hypothetical protein EAX87_03305, partial [Candidatus Thorarchaeota archaeon]|nr:hypothetical protein [Candidatus Thorarchaeota archaeon]